MKFRLFALLALVIGMAVPSANGFALRGPNEAYQTRALGYDTGLDAPQLIGEEYRWNIPIVTYGFDSSFINYFGTNGIRAIDAAFKALNDLPATSLITDQVLTNIFPLSSQAVNPTASALSILDVRSLMMTYMISHLGLSDPERFVYCLRHRYVTGNPSITNYIVIQRNYDPITRTPSDVVNGQRFGYAFVEGPGFADADETILGGGLNFASSVASWLTLNYGGSFEGLTRDDAGGMRYLYATNNFNVEGLLPGVGVVSSSAASQGSSWLPIGSTNLGTVITGGAVGNAIRGGIDKVTFVRVDFDSLLGIGFSGVTNSWVETFYANSVVGSQTLGRPILRPDFIFSAVDLGIVNNSVVATGYDTGNFINNDGINGLTGQNGPGLLSTSFQLRIDLTTQFPYYEDTFDSIAGPLTGLYSGVWGFFDSTTIYQVFPDFLNLQLSDLERMIIEARPEIE